jgi:hypothetical protein
MHRIQLLTLLANAVFNGLIVFLIKKKKLRIEYSLLWLFTSIALFIFIFFPKIIEKLSLLTGTYYLTTLIIIVFFFMFIIVFRFSITLSELSEKLNNLVQKLALFEEEEKRKKR